MGQAGLGIQPQGYRDTSPSPHPVIQPNLDNTGAEPPHGRRETKDVPETAGVLHQPCGAAQSPSPLPLALANTGREFSITCVTLLRPGEVHVAPASTGVAVPHVPRLFSLVRLSLCHLCYHHTSPQDPKPWLHRDRQHFRDSRRGGGFFQGVSEPQVMVPRAESCLQLPGLRKSLAFVAWDGDLGAKHIK